MKNSMNTNVTNEHDAESNSIALSIQKECYIKQNRQLFDTVFTLFSRSDSELLLDLQVLDAKTTNNRVFRRRRSKQSKWTWEIVICNYILNFYNELIIIQLGQTVMLTIQGLNTSDSVQYNFQGSHVYFGLFLMVLILFFLFILCRQ